MTDHTHHPDASEETAAEGPVVPDIDVATAQAKLASGGFLLDVREPEEWAAGHVEGATHQPLGDLDPSHYPANVEIMALCRSGNRSSKAARRLARAGRTVVNVEGGMAAWAEAGHPVVTDNGLPGTVK